MVVSFILSIVISIGVLIVSWLLFDYLYETPRQLKRIADLLEDMERDRE